MKREQLNDKQKTGKIIQLKEENQELKENKKRRKKTLAKLENEIDHKQRYEESQQRFETIFYKSTLGNKIISSDLCIRQVNKILVKWAIPRKN